MLLLKFFSTILIFSKAMAYIAWNEDRQRRVTDKCSKFNYYHQINEDIESKNRRIGRPATYYEVPETEFLHRMVWYYDVYYAMM
jgi:hypothetical protein